MVRRSGPTGPGPRRHALVTRDVLLLLLNNDFVLGCQAVYGYAVYAERLAAAGRFRQAAAVERRGQLEVTQAMALCQLIHDFGGTVTAPVDERAAVLAADRVADASWEREGVRRLKSRAGQLRAIGESALAERLDLVATVKQSVPDLAGLLARHREWPGSDHRQE
jgi:hypothetical protein